MGCEAVGHSEGIPQGWGTISPNRPTIALGDPRSDAWRSPPERQSRGPSAGATKVSFEDFSRSPPRPRRRGAIPHGFAPPTFFEGKMSVRSHGVCAPPRRFEPMCASVPEVFRRFASKTCLGLEALRLGDGQLHVWVGPGLDHFEFDHGLHPGDARFDPFGDDRPLQLGQSGDHVNQEPAGGRG